MNAARSPLPPGKGQWARELLQPGEVHVVMGSPRNLKITTPGDLELAEFYLSQENRRKAGVTG